MRKRSATKLAETEVLFREVNEGIAAAAERLEADETEFVCECGDAGCAERVVVPLEEYRRVRGHGARFLLAPGHEAAHVEEVIRRRRDYWVVEKVEATMRRIAKRLDPRHPR